MVQIQVLEEFAPCNELEMIGSHFADPYLSSWVNWKHFVFKLFIVKWYLSISSLGQGPGAHFYH